MNTIEMSGCGNGFLIYDGFDGPLPDDPSAAARERCASHEDLHGVLLVEPPRGEGHCRMRIYNSDGTRGEMCGNGLRCVGKYYFEKYRPEGDRILVETDHGCRGVEVTANTKGRVTWAEAAIGTPEILAPREPIEMGKDLLEATIVSVGNRHCILFVENQKKAPVMRIGRALQKHPRFPGGVNVGFATPDGSTLHLRTFERGVGETPACGTNACAAAAAAIQLGLSVSPVYVEMPGGRLEVSWTGFGNARVAGEVRRGLPSAPLDAEESAGDEAEAEAETELAAGGATAAKGSA